MASAALQVSPYDALSSLISKAKTHEGLNYAGDISAVDVVAFLSQQEGALVDVRTPQEWQAGMPDIAAKTALISWKTAPNMQLNPTFVNELAVAEINKQAPVFFLCRTGGRSLDAALEATKQGYSYAFNIAFGFEGDPNEAGVRGVVNGWKAANLPWKQG